MQNSGDRLQATANLAGFPIMASDLALQKHKIIFDMAARQANTPSGDVYRDMSLWRNDFLWEQAGDWLDDGGQIIGFAESLGVPLLQGMQLHSESSDTPFKALLLRDGWNLGKSEKLARNFMRYAGNWAVDTVQHSIARYRGKATIVPDYGWSQTEPTKPDDTALWDKLANVSDLMRSHSNASNARLLARRAAIEDFALSARTFNHGPTGSHRQQRRFVEGLTQEHAAALATFGGRCLLHAAVESGWHSDGLDPVRTAAALNETLDLLKS